MPYLRPSFFIIGERKCGTSSLYRYLLHHPQILPCRVKEPQLFTKKPWQIWWNIKKYYSLFPTLNHQGDIEIDWPELDGRGNLFIEHLKIKRHPEAHYLTGEASANTFYQANPRILHHYLPNIKLILLLRNPVDRTYSHYRMLRRFQKEGRQVGELLGFETEMLKAIDAVRKGRKHKLLSPSLYIQQMNRWLGVFPLEQFFIIRMEDLQRPGKAKKVMMELCQFLDISEHDFSEILTQKYNTAPAGDIPAGIQEELVHFFGPYNLVLEDLLERKFW